MTPDSKALTLIVRMWQAPDGSLKASVKPSEGGRTQHFSDLNALLSYLQTHQETLRLESEKGLR